MLRTIASLGLTFGAMAWAVIASIVVFFYGSEFWIGRLGRFGAFWGAAGAFVVALIVAKSMLRLADKLVESGAEISAGRALALARRAAAPSPPHPTRTTMAGRVTFDENQRGTRRTSIQAPKLERWAALEDDEALDAEGPVSPRAIDRGRRGLRPEARAGRQR